MKLQIPLSQNIVNNQQFHTVQPEVGAEWAWKFDWIINTNYECYTSAYEVRDENTV